MQDTNLVCAFSDPRAGLRYSVSDWLRCRVPGSRCQIAGTRYRVPGTGYLSSKNPHTGYAGCRIRRARILATQYPEPGT